MAASKKRPPAKRPVRLLSGGNPQIAKADGAAPVRAYLAALPGWKRAAGKRVDAMIVKAVPGVTKAVKWNSPLYGVPGQGWFLSIHAFDRFVRLTFFKGTQLEPMPPGTSKQAFVRYLDLHEDEPIDERQLTRWIRQAASLPGWMIGKP